MSQGFDLRTFAENEAFELPFCTLNNFLPQGNSCGNRYLLDL